MQAVCNRAYPAALVIMDTAKKLAVKNDKGETDQEVLMTMLYPSGSSLDNSPLHIICFNDTCSFTWTGAEHINQVRLNQGHFWETLLLLMSSSHLVPTKIKFDN